MVVPAGGRRTAAGQTGAVSSATHLRGIPAPSPLPASGTIPQHNHSHLQGKAGEIQPPLIICILFIYADIKIKKLVLNKLALPLHAYQLARLNIGGGSGEFKNVEFLALNFGVARGNFPITTCFTEVGLILKFP